MTRTNRKQAAALIWVMAATGQVSHGGHPSGHSVLYDAVHAVLEGGVIAALTTWISFAIFSAVEKRANADAASPAALLSLSLPTSSF